MIFKPHLVEDNEGSQMDTQYSDSVMEQHQRLKKKVAEKEQKKKAYKAGVKDAGYDSDDERENAHLMFMNDLNNLRKYFINIMDNNVRVQEQMQSDFNKERDNFSWSQLRRE